MVVVSVGRITQNMIFTFTLRVHFVMKDGEVIRNELAPH